MYFSNFPKIYYDFQQDVTSESLQILADITANVRFRKEVLENITLYDEYDMMEGETPEIVAEKIYGNAQLHWIIMLFNERYDYLSDFPMTNAELYEFCIDKYGEDHLEDVHHYEKDGIITNGVATLEVSSDIAQSAKPNDIINGLPKTSATVKQVDLTTNTLILNMSFGRFIEGQEAALNGVRYDASIDTNIYSTIANFTVGSDAFAVNSAYSLVTNYEYELNENEKKRRIKLISPTLVNQIVSEFNKLIVT